MTKKKRTDHVEEISPYMIKENVTVHEGIPRGEGWYVVGRRIHVGPVDARFLKGLEGDIDGYRVHLIALAWKWFIPLVTTLGGLPEGMPNICESLMPVVPGYQARRMMVFRSTGN